MKKIEDLIIKTEYGYIQGFLDDSGIKFLGVPYAKKPIGDLRFKHPVKPDSWSDVLECIVAPHNPIQTKTEFEYEYTSEDCLYLNVFMPKDIDKNKKLPVAVWIFGGSYEMGGIGYLSENDHRLHYDLSTFSNDTNTIAIAINYRLNAFGFLNLHSLSNKFDINNGFYDIKMALEFINNNIEAFGGDKDNITLFGESAGGALTLSMLASDKTCYLFNKVIVESACVDHFYSLEESKKIAKLFLKKAKIKLKNVDDVLTLSTDEIRDALAKVSKKLMMSGNITSPFSPVIDKEFLEDYPKHIVIKRKHPMLIGINKYEGDFFVKELSGFLLRMVNILTPVVVKRGKEPLKIRVADALTDYIFYTPMMDIVEAYQGPVWVYEYNHISPELANAELRCCHTAELSPLFQEDDEFGKSDDPDLLILGKYIRSIWGSHINNKINSNPYRKSKEKIIINKDEAIKNNK